MKYPVYNIKGEKIKDLDLNDNIFNIDINPTLIHEVVVAQMANSRPNIAHTKLRGEVRGGGKKPWSQKGTGRARHGSIRSPLWRGGGVTFGPRNDRNFAKKVNKKTKRKAIFMALTDRFANNNVVLLDQITIEQPKTKNVSEMFAGLFDKIYNKEEKKNFNTIGYKFLIVTPETDRELIMSTRNIPKVKVIRADSLNVKDLVDFPKIVILEKSIDIIENNYQIK